MPLITDSDILRAALVGYGERLKVIDARISLLRERLGALADLPIDDAPSGGRRPLSAGARAGAKQPGKTSKASGPSRLSAEGRARIIEATKKRWAQFRAAAAKAKRKPPAKNKTANKAKAAPPVLKQRGKKRVAAVKKSTVPADQPAASQPAGQ